MSRLTIAEIAKVSKDPLEGLRVSRISENRLVQEICDVCLTEGPHEPYVWDGVDLARDSLDQVRAYRRELLKTLNRARG